ncbi:hypothetical protein WN48_02105 [Eufriesea mexicana]|nr:hypothetical protein WN48_02105 [Eufriesea mexicana]
MREKAHQHEHVTLKAQEEECFKCNLIKHLAHGCCKDNKDLRTGNDGEIMFKANEVIVYENEKIILVGNRYNNGLYSVEESKEKIQARALLVEMNKKLISWHRKLSHLSIRNMKELFKNALLAEFLFRGGTKLKLLRVESTTNQQRLPRVIREIDSQDEKNRQITPIALPLDTGHDPDLFLFFSRRPAKRIKRLNGQCRVN